MKVVVDQSTAEKCLDLSFSFKVKLSLFVSGFYLQCRRKRRLKDSKVSGPNLKNGVANNHVKDE